MRFIEDEIKHDGQVYVHCMLGVGRSATLVLAYLGDRQVYPRFGAASWLGLRLHLTSVAALSCVVGALAV